MSKLHNVQVAISADFLKAFSKIPKAQQKKVRSWVEKFKHDPTQKSINYEKITSKDPKVRTVRIDQAWRAIVIAPPQGDVYLCVWVDHHDEAMAWARNKMFEVNPHTGTFQVWQPVEGAPKAEVVEVPKVSASTDDKIPETRLLGGHTDDDLLFFGVPAPLLPAVRALRTEADLDELCPHLPDEAADALYLLAAGYSIEDALEELDRAPESTEKTEAIEVDVEDFGAALARPQSKRTFKLVEDDHELAGILAAPLEQWRIFLHPSQEKIVSMHSKGSARVLGGAGTGKTVVAMHRARFLAKEVFKGEGERILFTTFTANLANDIEQHLDLLCGAERERIEVANLHRWAREFLASRGMKMGKVVQNKMRRQLWQNVKESYGADSLPQSFYEEEWDKVVQAQDVVDLEGYLRARRAGRGTRITRNQRKEIWRVLEAYRRKLDDAQVCENADVIREARLLLEQKPGSSGFSAVVADEVQDFRTADLMLLRALVPEGPNDIFVVGDAHQRIYGHKASLGRCGINVRGRRSRRLRVNYRTTQRIRNWAMARLKGLEIDDLDDGKDSAKGERSLRLGEMPKAHLFQSLEEEQAFIVETVRGWIEQGVKPAEVCIAARTNKLVDDLYLPALVDAGIDATKIVTESGSALGEGVRVATMHRVKGLEFPRVLLAGIQDGNMPLRASWLMFPDEKSQELHDEGERKLLYVAATRARDELVVTGHGEGSGFGLTSAGAGG